MHLRASLCAALLFAQATVVQGAVRHYIIGLDPQTTYDVWQGNQLIAQGSIPGPAGDLTFESATVSPVSVLPSGAPPDQVPPATVDDLSDIDSSETTITLSWTSVGDDGNTGQASTYDLRYATYPISQGTWNAATQVAGEPLPKPAGQPESFTVTGLSPGTTYYFAMKVADEVPNWSGISNLASGTTDAGVDSTPPAAIANLSIDGTTQTTATLVWTAVGDDGNTGQASTYDLRYATFPINSGSWNSATQVVGEPNPKPAGQAESLTVSNLSPATTYYFAMKVADEVPNWSGLSNVPSGATLPEDDEIPPSEITNLAVAETEPTSATLVWSAVGDDGNTGQASLYDIRYSTTPITSETWPAAEQIEGEPNPKPAGQAETFLIHDLEPETTYYFAIKVADEIPNWSGLSNVADGTTPPPADTIPPAEIDDLSLATKSESSVTVVWTSVGDDGEEGQASTYDLRYSTAPITDETWGAASQAGGEPDPKPAGQAESFTIADLEAATLYYFAIRVADEVPNWSGLSNVLSAETDPIEEEDAEPPATILTLAVDGSEEGAIQLDWIATGDDGEQGQASTYDLRYATEPITVETWPSATQVHGEPTPKPAGEEENFAVEGLDQATIYYFALVVGDEVPNWSAISNVASGETLPPPGDEIPPAEVTSLDAEPTTATSITLTWTAVGDDGTEGQATSYDCRYSSDPIGEESWDSATQATGEPDPLPSGETETFVVTGLAPGTQYYFAIKVADEVPNWSEISNLAVATTPGMPDIHAPDIIPDLDTADIGHRSVHLTWTAPADDEETESVTSYQGRYDSEPIDEESWEIAESIPGMPTPSAPGETESVEVVSLEPGQTYYFSIRAVDEAGNIADLGNVLEVTTTSEPDTVPPLTISDLISTDVSATAVTLRWTAPADAIPEDCIETPLVVRYDIRYSKSSLEGEGWGIGTSVEGPDPAEPGTLQSLEVAGLTPDTRYYFAIRSIDWYGNESSTSNVCEQTTSPPDELPDTIEPGPVTDLAAEATQHDQVLLSWTAPGGDGSEGQADHYDVRRASSPLEGAVWENATPILPPPPCNEAGMPETLRVDGLEPETTYYFALRAVDATGNKGPISASAGVHTPIAPDTQAPQPVTDLEAVEADTNSVLLRWTAPDDDRGACASYELRYATSTIDESTWDSASPVSNLPIPADPGTIESFRVENLLPETQWAFAIRSIDGAGNRSSLSNLAWAATDTIPDPPDRTPPATITDLSADPLDENRVLLTWTAPGDDGSEGRADAYELRSSNAPIDATTWDSAIVIAIDFQPAEAGEAESFIVTDLAPDTEYHFALRARDDEGNLGDCSPDAEAETPPIPDTNPPAPPSGLTAQLNGDRVLLQWPQSPEPDVVGYVLYRREMSPGSTESVAFLGLVDDRYTDALIMPDAQYAYSVAAEDASGNLSQPSDEVAVATRLDDFLPEISDFDARGAVEISGEAGLPLVRLDWNAVVGVRFAGFIVERSEDGGDNWSLRTTTPISDETEYLFEESISTGHYLYRISAVSQRGYVRGFTPIQIRWEGAIAENSIDEPYPNPSLGAVHLNLRLADAERVEIVLFDLSGRRVEKLYDGLLQPGVHPWSFDAVEIGSERLPTGLYFLRVHIGDSSFVRKVVLHR